MNNKVISNAITLARIILWITYILFTVFGLIVVIWHFNPDFFQHLNISKKFNPGLSAFNLNINKSKKPLDEFYALSDLNHFMIYWLFIRGSILFIFTIFIIRKIILVLQSIKSLDTFYEGNIQHFKSMAKYGFVIFFMSCFNFSYINNHFDIGITLSFGPLAFSVACLVLTEVFKEGKHLLEDKNLIV